VYYSMIVHSHAAAGAVALAAFWTTAALPKGTRTHRRVGAVYLLAMLLLMLTAPPMAFAAFASGQPVTGVFLGYLTVITGTALWMAWRAVRDRASPAAFHGPAFRALAWLNLASAATVLVLGADRRQPILVGMAAIGLVVGGRMLVNAARASSADPRWWLQRHYGGIVGCGIATHVAFLNIGLQRWLPADLGAVAAYVGWFGPVIVAVVAKAWLDRRYGRPAATAALPEGA
jgi:hypothetical protein